MNKNFILALIFSIFFLSPAYSQESSCRCDEGLFWDGENCVDVGITCIPSLFPICDCNGVVFKNLCEAKKSGVKKFINAHCSDFNISSCTCENEEPVSLDCFSGQSCKFENQLDSEAIASEFSGVWKIHIPGEALFLYGGLNKFT